MVSTIVISLLLLCAVAAILRSLHRKRRQGGSSCGCGCGSCGGCSGCGEPPKKQGR